MPKQAVSIKAKKLSNAYCVFDILDHTRRMRLPLINKINRILFFLIKNKNERERDILPKVAPLIHKQHVGIQFCKLTIYSSLTG